MTRIVPSLFFLFLSLAPPTDAAVLPKWALAAALCGACVTGNTGCGSRVPPAPEQTVWTVNSAPLLKEKIDHAASDRENRLLPLRYFAAAAGLTVKEVKMSEVIDLPPAKFFRGVYFRLPETGDEVIGSTRFFAALTAEQQVLWELELESLGDYFVKRFDKVTPRRVTVHSRGVSNRDQQITFFSEIPALQVVFTRGGGSSIRDATAVEWLRVVNTDWVGLEALSANYAVRVITLDIEELEKNRDQASRKWRELLSTRYPGEF